MIQNELNTIVHLYKKVPSFRFIIITKRVTSDKKINILKNTLQNFDPLVREFISLIITDGHAENLLTIISYYNKLAHAKLNIKDVDLIVAHKLDPEYIEKLTRVLSEILKTIPKINVIIATIIPIKAAINPPPIPGPMYALALNEKVKNNKNKINFCIFFLLINFLIFLFFSIVLHCKVFLTN